MPASADVNYSNLQNISIPANFDWLYLDVEGSNRLGARGEAIVTGNVLQSAAANNAQTVTFTTASGSIALGSTITNPGSTLTWTVVPEPTSELAGLRRRGRC